jgi:hypothetical protein
MQRVTAGLTIGLGVVALLGTLLWCWAGAGIYGSPLAHFHGSEFAALLLLFLVGPLSILPAGIVGRRRPGIAGAWLLASSLLCFLLILGGTLNGGFEQFFRRSPTFEATCSVAAVCLPPLLPGIAFLKVWVDARAVPLPWRGIKIAAGVVLALGVLAWGVYLLQRPIWTVTFSPAEGPTRRLTLDARSLDYATVKDAVDSFFKDSPVSGRKALGSYELSGPLIGGGDRLRFEFVVERTPELLVIYRNGTFFTAYREDPEVFAAARRGAANHIASIVVLNGARAGRP